MAKYIFRINKYIVDSVQTSLKIFERYGSLDDLKKSCIEAFYKAADYWEELDGMEVRRVRGEKYIGTIQSPSDAYKKLNVYKEWCEKVS